MVKHADYEKNKEKGTTKMLVKEYISRAKTIAGVVQF